MAFMRGWLESTGSEKCNIEKAVFSEPQQLGMATLDGFKSDAA